MIKKKVLILGSSGQIGKHLIRKLTKNNYKVICQTRNAHKSVFLKKNGCVVIEPWFAQDIDTEEDWQFAELKFQTLIDNNFHLA